MEEDKIDKFRKILHMYGWISFKQGFIAGGAFGVLIGGVGALLILKKA